MIVVASCSSSSSVTDLEKLHHWVIVVNLWSKCKKNKLTHDAAIYYAYKKKKRRDRSILSQDLKNNICFVEHQRWYNPSFQRGKKVSQKYSQVLDSHLFFILFYKFTFVLYSLQFCLQLSIQYNNNKIKTSLCFTILSLY